MLSSTVSPLFVVFCLLQTIFISMKGEDFEYNLLIIAAERLALSV